MAASIPRNAAELDKLFQGVKELQSEAGRVAEKSIAASTGAVTFEQELEQKIARGELSPELRRREREAVSGLFGAAADIRGRFEGVPVRPTELGNIIAGRVNSYLNQINDIQNQRKGRQSRIDDLIKTGAIQAQAEATTTGLQTEQKRFEAQQAAQEFRFLFSEFKEDERARLKRIDDQKETPGITGVFDDTTIVLARSVEKVDPETGTTLIDLNLLDSLTDSKGKGQVLLYLEQKNLIGEKTNLEDLNRKFDTAIAFNKEVELTDNEIRMQLWDDLSNGSSYEDSVTGIGFSPIRNKDRAFFIAEEVFGRREENIEEDQGETEAISKGIIVPDIPITEDEVSGEAIKTTRDFILNETIFPSIFNF